MFPALILAIAMLGQSPTLQKIEITYGGADLIVEGFIAADGMVHWKPNSPFNAAAIANSRVRKSADPFPGGVSPKRIKGPSYHASGEKARQYVAEIKREGPTDGKLHLTVIGTADERARVVNDIKTDAAFDTLRENLLVQDYSPEEWPVDPSLGFQPGKPAILLQAGKGPNDPRGGRVLDRAADYSMGPERLAEAVRKADPDYKPEDDPGPANDDDEKKPPPKPGPAKCPLGINKANVPYVIGAVALFAIIALMPRKEG